MGELTWAPPAREDEDAWLDLLAAMEAADQMGETHGPEDIDDEWRSVWSHPDTDARFVWDGELLVAFGWLKTVPGARTNHRIDLWGGVRPSHRERGLGRQVMEWQVDRASAVAATMPAAVPTRLEVVVGDRQESARRLAASLGFEPERRFLEVARPVASSLPEVAAPVGLVLVPWSEDVDEAIRASHADAFADHWGSEPRSEEEWRQWYTGHRCFRADLSFVALEAGTGQVASFVLTAAYPQDWDTTAPEAWINTVGTVRPWRGRGAARWVLTAALGAIATSSTGFDRAILGVDAENPTGALALYRSLGFDDVRSVTSMRRAPDPR